jgi:hypothetical protein
VETVKNWGVVAEVAAQGNLWALRAHFLDFCSPVSRGSWRVATEGVFLSAWAMVEANTPSALRAPPPRGGGGKRERAALAAHMAANTVCGINGAARAARSVG